MNPTPEIALAAGLLVTVTVLVGLGWVLAKRGVRWYFMRDLNRRVARVQKILDRHAKERFARVDRLLFQLGDTRDREAVEIALGELLASEEATVRPQLRAIYDNIGLIEHYTDRLQNSGKWNERSEAARTLGQLGVVEAIPLLVARMRDPHEDVQSVKRAAGQALAMMQADEAIPLMLAELSRPDDWASPRLAELLLGFGDKARMPLQEALNNDESTNARMWAAQILGRLGDSSASAALVARLKDRSEQVRISVTEALGRLQDRRAIPELARMALRDPVPTVRAEAARALGNIGDPSVLDELVLLLSSSDYWTRLRAVEAIEKLQPEDTYVLEQALEDDSRVVRGQAARALERLGVLDRRIRDLCNDDMEIVSAAISSLILFGKAGSTDSLLKCINDPGLKMRARICSVLGEVGDSHALPALVALLEDDLWPVRLRAAEAIGKLRPDNALEILLPVLSDSEEMVRIAAVGAIQSLGLADPGEGLAALMELFERGNAEARCSVIDLIKPVPTELVETLLLQALRDPDAEVRLHAVRELRGRPGDLWTEPLIGLLADAGEQVRKEAARVLGKDPDDRAITAIAESMSTPDIDFREILTDMIAPLGPHRILEVVGHTDILEKRLALVWALGKTGDPEAIPELERLSEDREPRVRAAVAGAAAKIEDPACRKIMSRLLLDPNSRVRSAAINGAGLLGDARLLPRLLELIDEPDDFVRGRLSIALGMISGEPAIEGIDVLAGRSDDPGRRAFAVIGYGLTGMKDGTEKSLRALTDGAVEAAVEKVLAGERREVRERFTINISLQDEDALDDLSTAHLREIYSRQVRNSRDDGRRAAAIDAISAIGIGEHTGVLIGAVSSDPSPHVRGTALHCLEHNIHEDRVSSAIRRALRDPVEDVRLAAVRSLATAASPENNGALLACGTAGNGAITEAAVNALAETNSGRLREFIEELSSRTEPPILATGALVLGRIGDPAAHEPLEGWLQGTEPALRAASVRALGRLGTTKARDTLAGALSDPVVDVRLAITEAITRFPMEGVYDALMRLAHDPSVEVRTRLAESLAGRECVQAIDTAGKLAADPDEDVRSRALISLLRMGTGSSARRFIETFEGQPPAVCRELYEIPLEHEIVQAVCSLATDDADPETRVTAIETIETLRKEPLETFLKAMEDPDPRVRLGALRASSGMDDPSLDAMRERLLRDPVAEVRNAVRKGKFKVIRHPSSGA